MSGSSSSSEISADFVFGGAGPGGDTKVDFTKKDVGKMRHVLAQVMSLLNNYDIDNLSDEDLNKLITEIRQYELQSVLKHDLVAIKSELQNKYHAELEILREDFDNRIDLNNVEHENNLRKLEQRYLEEVQDLNMQLRGRISTTVQQEVVSYKCLTVCNRFTNVCCLNPFFFVHATQKANSGEFEIDEVVQSYERRLQEQVTLAKIDIIHALECQIQVNVGVGVKLMFISFDF